jgi:hypothetical protein
MRKLTNHQIIAINHKTALAHLMIILRANHYQMKHRQINNHKICQIQT